MAVLDRLWQTPPLSYGHRDTQARHRPRHHPGLYVSSHPRTRSPVPHAHPHRDSRPPPRPHGLHAVHAAVARAWPRRCGGRGRRPRSRAPHARRCGEERHGRHGRGRSRLLRRGSPFFRGSLPRAALAPPSTRPSARPRSAAPAHPPREGATLPRSAATAAVPLPPTLCGRRPPQRDVLWDGRRRRRRGTNRQIGWPAGSPTTTREPPGEQPLVASPPPTLGRPLASLFGGRRLGTRRLQYRADACEGPAVGSEHMPTRTHIRWRVMGEGGGAVSWGLEKTGTEAKSACNPRL